MDERASGLDHATQKLMSAQTMHDTSKDSYGEYSSIHDNMPGKLVELYSTTPKRVNSSQCFLKLLCAFNHLC